MLHLNWTFWQYLANKYDAFSLSVKHQMDITELHHYIAEVAEGLPDVESKQLLEIRDSLENLGPNEWSSKLALFANEMLLKNIGNQEKLMRLEAEAENAGSVEIKLTYLLLAIILIALVVYNV